MSLTWFFAAIYLADALFSASASGAWVAWLGIACVVVGAVASWKLFVRPTNAAHR